MSKESQEFIRELTDNGYTSPTNAPKAGDSITDEVWLKAQQDEQGSTKKIEETVDNPTTIRHDGIETDSLTLEDFIDGL